MMLMSRRKFERRLNLMKDGLRRHDGKKDEFSSSSFKLKNFNVLTESSRDVANCYGKRT